MSPKQIELEIIDLAIDGKAVAHNDGKVVFIKGGLPGEVVLAEITRSKARYDEAVLVEIIKKSEARRPAPCSHFEYCGGCTWQDLVYEEQLGFKKKQVEECMTRLGHFEEADVADIIGSVELFEYRNKMEFSFNVDAEEERGFTLGLHERGRFDKIFDLDHCHLQSETASRIVAWTRDFVSSHNIPVYDVFEHTGFMRFLMIRQSKRTADLMVNVVTNYGEFPHREQFVAGLLEAVPEVTTILHNQNGQKSNIAVGEVEKILYGRGFIEECLFDLRFRIKANAFFQTNTIQTETLYRTGFELLEPKPHERVLDLYCGTGSIGILISNHVKEVVGVELVTDAVAAANENAKLNGIKNISFYEGNVKDFLKSIDPGKPPFDVIIIDPPRAGLHPKALKRMLQLSPERILYISCNPSTFARDARSIVDAGYGRGLTRPIDMFPHTRHIELVTVFERN